jgi:serine/threonine protein kinase/lipoprotein NlpI
MRTQKTLSTVTATIQIIPSRKIGARFEVLALLGVGGMGEVYRARDTRLKRDVALKRISRSHPSVQASQRALLREAQRTSRLSSTHIAQVHDVIEEKEELFIVMEYVDGKSLRQILGKPIVIGEALRIAAGCAKGLASAHEKHIVHHDVKPENILIGNAGEVKLCDFGLAKQLRNFNETTTDTVDKRILGTPAYMAPEVLQGHIGDERADVYALGIVLYEMLTGSNPFKDNSVIATAQRVLHETPVPTSKRCASIPARVDRIIGRAIARNPKDRYRNAQELLNDLEAVEPAEASAGETNQTRALDRDSVEARSPGADVEPWTVAVFPCANIGEASTEYWADGMTEAIISALSAFPLLRVTSRSAVMRFKGTAPDPREIRKRLNVETLLESSVQRSGKRVRVTARLVRTLDGFEIWSARFEQPFGRGFDLQDKIAAEIARTFQAHRANREAGPVKSLDGVAFDLYLRGRQSFYQYDRRGIDTAIDLFRQAIDLNPDFALAHAGLAMAYCQYVAFNWDPNRSWVAKAFEAAGKARELAPQEPEVHFALGFVYRLQNQLLPAYQEFQETVSLNPSHAHAHSSVAYLEFKLFGRLDRATEQYQAALKVDPFLLGAIWHCGHLFAIKGNFAESHDLLTKAQYLNSESEYTWLLASAYHQLKGEMRQAASAITKTKKLAPSNPLVHWAGGLTSELSSHYTSALRDYKKALECDPSFFVAHAGQARVLYRLSRFKSALRAAEKALACREDPDWSMWFFPGGCRALRVQILKSLGFPVESKQESRRLLAEIPDQPANALVAYQLARICALLEKPRLAMKWLVYAVDHGWRTYPLFWIEPDLESLRDNPFFIRFVPTTKTGKT